MACRQVFLYHSWAWRHAVHSATGFVGQQLNNIGIAALTVDRHRDALLCATMLFGNLGHSTKAYFKLQSMANLYRVCKIYFVVHVDRLAPLMDLVKLKMNLLTNF